MTKLRVLDLFSGIGGFSLGLHRAGGFETAMFCEIEPFCQRVLAHNFPGVYIHDNICTLTPELIKAKCGEIDIICGGFPCQDVSSAGKRAGIREGTRSGLWAHYARLILDLRPKFAIMENVSGLLSLGMGTVLGDLAEVGYDAEWESIPASAVGAKHSRDRVWIVAYPTSVKGNGVSPNQCRKVFRPEFWSTQLRGQGNADTFGATPEPEWVIHQSGVGGVVDGVPNRVERLKAFGNSVVPQIPELIGYSILEAQK
jgi:DNA (cytosine-5)-methyltransferase 1